MPAAECGAVTRQEGDRVSPGARLAALVESRGSTLQPSGAVRVAVTLVTVPLSALLTVERTVPAWPVTRAPSTLSCGVMQEGWVCATPRSSTRKLSSEKSTCSPPPWFLYRPTKYSPQAPAVSSSVKWVGVVCCGMSVVSR